ncbi:MAG: hypothetical protein AAF490_21330 [Chloroflexota bacterium]
MMSVEKREERGEKREGSAGPDTRMISTHRAWVFWGTAVLLLAAFLRTVWLADIPPGLAQDEVLNADIVTFIRGGEHALFFRHGFGHEPLYHYYAVPFQILLGDNLLSIRLPAVYLGLLLIAATIRWVKRDFGAMPAIITGFSLAISWWPIIFSRIGLRPIMEPLLLVGMAWFWKRPLLAGLFLGLSFYTYTGARVVLLIPLIVWGWQVARGRWRGNRHQATVNNQSSTKNEPSPNPSAKLKTHLPITQSPNHLITPFFDQSQDQPPSSHSLITFLTALLIALPMQITLWRDPSLQQRVDQLSGPIDALLQGNVQPIWQTTVATLGVFSFTGDPRWTYTLPERPLFDPITSIFFYIGLIWLIYQVRKPQNLLVLVWFIITLVPSAITPQAPSIIRIIGALPLVYLMVGLGIEQVGHWLRYSIKNQWVKTAVFAPMLLFLLLFNLNRTVQNGFIAWPNAQETQAKYQTTLLHMSRYLKQVPSDRPPLLADSFFEPIDADSFQRNLGYDPNARWVQLAPNAGALVWPNGQPTRLFTPEFAAIPVELFHHAGFAEQPIYRSESAPSFAVYQLPSLDYTAVDDTLLFNNVIQLVGVEMPLYVNQETVEIYTYWKVYDPLPWDLTAFVHVLGDTPQPVTQHDGFDVATENLQPNDIILQRHSLVLPENLERPYDIHIGLYLSQTGERWQILANSEETYLFKDEFLFDGNGGDE